MEPLIPQRELVHSPTEIIEHMQRIAAPCLTAGELEQLPPVITEGLRSATLELLQLPVTVENEDGDPVETTYGEIARREYLRYIGTKERELLFSEEAKQGIAEILNGKTVLVTGATGVIAGPMLELLEENGVGRIVGVQRGTRTPGEDYTHVDTVEYRNCDVRDKAGLREIFDDVKPDVVIHLAAERSPGRAELDPEYAITTNIDGTTTLLEVMEEFADAEGRNELPRYVHASTGKALRPFSPDVYAASKKTSELLISRFARNMAAKGKKFLANAGRFTHNVDGSIVDNQINKALDANSAITMHDPGDEFYIESARESAQLLLLGMLEAQEGELTVAAINDLDKAMRLLNLSLGAIAHRTGGAEGYAALENPPFLYYHGKPQGYEGKPYPFLYHPRLSMDVGPLISAIDGAVEEAKSSEHPNASGNYQLDMFRLRFPQYEGELDAQLEMVRTACNMGLPPDALRMLMQSVSWAGLETRLEATPGSVLTTMSKFVGQARSAKMAPEFAETNNAVQRVHAKREARKVLGGLGLAA